MKYRTADRTASVTYQPLRRCWRVRLYARDSSLALLTCGHGGRDLTYRTQDRQRAELGASLFVNRGALAFSCFWFHMSSLSSQLRSELLTSQS